MGLWKHALGSWHDCDRILTRLCQLNGLLLSLAGLDLRAHHQDHLGCCIHEVCSTLDCTLHADLQQRHVSTRSAHGVR